MGLEIFDTDNCLFSRLTLRTTGQNPVSSCILEVGSHSSTDDVGSAVADGISFATMLRMLLQLLTSEMCCCWCAATSLCRVEGIAKIF